MAQLADLLSWAGALLLIAGGGIVACYWLLALVALTTRAPGGARRAATYHRFLIIIPAHNEERSLARTLRSCLALSYPKERFEVCVVADNCSDRTAEIARQHGVDCLVREDRTQLGKGYALEFAFRRVNRRQHDAVLVLDADCVLSEDSLLEFNERLLAGDKVLQANFVASNPDVSVISYVLAVGNAIENDLFYAPLSRLGSTILLRGTGMVFHREVLERHPWTAFSVAEDAEYSLTLARSGIWVRLVEQAVVRSEYPCDLVQMTVQRRRHAAGNLRFARSQAVRLLWEGLRARRRTLIETGVTLLLLSRPLVLILVAAPLGLGSAAFLMRPAVSSRAVVTVAAVVMVCLVFYLLLGALLLGVTRRRARLLFSAPSVVLRLALIALGGVLGNGGEAWRRTPR